MKTEVCVEDGLVHYGGVLCCRLWRKQVLKSGSSSEQVA